MKKLFAIFCLFLTACTSLPAVKDLPAQEVESRLFKVEEIENKQVKQVSLLTVQFEPNQWRWVQTDPLGAPLARVLLSKQGWQNDGFIMPNAQARQLFAALATGLNKDTNLFDFSQIERTASGQVFYIHHKKVWKIDRSLPTLEIELADGSVWKIEELE
ncbi:hypothetical protein A4G20_10545 [Pasteurellaceae bacterium RH1A]|nr:hypothetical protein A4G20_10545 [Pasteurellaceae bacterium RH1A]